MANPLGSDASGWEWIEVYNASGSAVDLNGYVINKRNFDQDDAVIVSADSALVPQGETVVLYTGAANGAEDQAFRTAWNLPATTRLASVPNLPALANSGANRNLGFWANQTDYMSDWIDDGEGGFQVGGFASTIFHIDYTTDGFPAIASGASNAWSGDGDYRDGANWVRSEEGVGGAVVSTQVLGAPTPVNSTEDVGSPGVVPSGDAPAPGLLITEVMFNPSSSDSAWEWIEVLNNTGASIDFAVTPYVFDDIAGGALNDANVAAGVVGDGETVVLYDAGSLTEENLRDAWDPGGANSTNFIAVSHWPALNNGGDQLGLWNDFDSYDFDSASEERVFDSAQAALAYGNADASSEWPSDDGAGSIFLTSLAADAADGANWELSQAGSDNAFHAAEAIEVAVVHAGGDVGSPGVFGESPPTAAADFNGDARVDDTDLAIWESAFGGAASSSSGDANGDGLASGDDFLLWQRQHADAASIAAAPEPTGLSLACLAVSALVARWSMRR